VRSATEAVCGEYWSPGWREKEGPAAWTGTSAGATAAKAAWWLRGACCGEREHSERRRGAYEVVGSLRLNRAACTAFRAACTAFRAACLFAWCWLAGWLYWIVAALVAARWAGEVQWDRYVCGLSIKERAHLAKADFLHWECPKMFALFFADHGSFL
jgi:hypothetical protein